MGGPRASISSSFLRLADPRIQRAWTQWVCVSLVFYLKRHCPDVEAIQHLEVSPTEPFLLILSDPSQDHVRSSVHN